MGTTLADTKLADLLPENLKGNVKNLCFAAAFDEIRGAVYSKIKYIWFFSRVDSLSGDELTLLAAELHVDVYDENWTLEQKRATCKNSIKWHIYKGTPWMLEDYVVQVYGSSKLQEWFEYGGLPYHFRILVELVNNDLNDEVLNKLSQAISIYKNQRSILDGLSLNFIASCKPSAVSVLKSESITMILPEES